MASAIVHVRQKHRNSTSLNSTLLLPSLSTQILLVSQIYILNAMKWQGSLGNWDVSCSSSVVPGGTLSKQCWPIMSTSGAAVKSSELHLLASSTALCLTQAVSSTFPASNFLNPLYSNPQSGFFWVISLLKSWFHSRVSCSEVAF